jgi:hypothetical protein
VKREPLSAEGDDPQRTFSRACLRTVHDLK